MNIKPLLDMKELLKLHKDEPLNVNIVLGVVNGLIEAIEMKPDVGWIANYRIRQVDFKNSDKPEELILEHSDGSLIVFKRVE